MNPIRVFFPSFSCDVIHFSFYDDERNFNKKRSKGVMFIVQYLYESIEDVVDWIKKRQSKKNRRKKLFNKTVFFFYFLGYQNNTHTHSYTIFVYFPMKSVKLVTVHRDISIYLCAIYVNFVCKHAGCWNRHKEGCRRTEQPPMMFYGVPNLNIKWNRCNVSLLKSQEYFLNLNWCTYCQNQYFPIYDFQKIIYLPVCLSLICGSRKIYKNNNLSIYQRQRDLFWYKIARKIT